MLLEKFYGLIERSPFKKAIDYQARLIEQLDPQRIYPENIRSFFHVPMGVAKWLCERAVKEGIFEKRVGFLCPNCERILAETEEDESPPAVLECEVCDATNAPDTHFFKSDDCRKIVFYRMREKDGD